MDFFWEEDLGIWGGPEMPQKIWEGKSQRGVKRDGGEGLERFKKLKGGSPKIS